MHYISSSVIPPVLFPQLSFKTCSVEQLPDASGSSVNRYTSCSVTRYTGSSVNHYTSCVVTCCTSSSVVHYTSCLVTCYTSSSFYALHHQLSYPFHKLLKLPAIPGLLLSTTTVPEVFLICPLSSTPDVLSYLPYLVIIYSLHQFLKKHTISVLLSSTADIEVTCHTSSSVITPVAKYLLYQFLSCPLHQISVT